MGDAYGNSLALQKLCRAQEKGAARLACFDIDSTLTGEPASANAIRAILDSGGYALMFDTSRTEEMLMSAETYERSRRAGQIHRPPPRLGGRPGHRAWQPPEESVPAGILDGDILAASSGTRILVRQDDGTYLPDRLYQGRYGEPPDEWRAATEGLLDRLLVGIEGGPAGIDRPGAYQHGEADVFPPDYRVQVNLAGAASKQRFLQRFREAQRTDPVARRRRIIDDSKPPTAFKVFVVPHGASKARAVEEVVNRLCALGVNRSHLHVLFAGDSFPDLAMGLYGALGADVTFLLAGGSRLAADLLAGQPFAGEPLAAIRRRLHFTGRPGFYRFQLPCRFGSRILIVGDAAFPGLTEVDTVLAYLQHVSP